MVDLELIALEDGNITRLTRNISFGNTLASRSIRNHHKRKLIEAIKSLDLQSSKTRKNESITFTMRKTHFKKLGDKIEKVVDTFLENIEEDEHDKISTHTIALYSRTQ